MYTIVLGEGESFETCYRFESLGEALDFASFLADCQKAQDIYPLLEWAEKIGENANVSVDIKDWLENFAGGDYHGSLYLGAVYDTKDWLDLTKLFEFSVESLTGSPVFEIHYYDDCVEDFWECFDYDCEGELDEFDEFLKCLPLPLKWRQQAAYEEYNNPELESAVA